MSSELMVSMLRLLFATACVFAGCMLWISILAAIDDLPFYVEI